MLADADSQVRRCRMVSRGIARGPTGGGPSSAVLFDTRAKQALPFLAYHFEVYPTPIRMYVILDHAPGSSIDRPS